MQKPSVSDEARARIKSFVAELQKLCNKHRVDIEAPDEMPGVIAIIDRKRKPIDGWPYDAYFAGADKRGVYTHTPNGDPRNGIRIETFEGYGA